METISSTTLKLHSPLPTHRLAGRVALITGGAGKIGIETAGRFLREGANVVLVDNNASALEAALNVLREAVFSGELVCSRLLTIKAEVTDETQVEECVKESVKQFKRLDVAFLNAGTGTVVGSEESACWETGLEEFERVMRGNVRSAFLCLKHVAAAMRDLGNGGSIILTSSVAGLHGSPGHIAYSASKFALRGLALTAAEELGPYGIRVNTIHPSRVETPMFRNSCSREKMEELRAAIPLGRCAQVDDVASVVDFLASEDSKFMTGGFLKIDGGSVPF